MCGEFGNGSVTLGHAAFMGTSVISAMLVMIAQARVMVACPMRLALPRICPCPKE